MGQKVSPHGLRLGVIKNWSSRWFAGKKDYSDLVVEDYKLREFLKARLYQSGVSKIEIERGATRIKIYIYCSKPGIVIGKGGAEIEKLKAELEKKLKGQVYVNIVEVKTPDRDAQLIAENVAFQLERRISFRRAMKQAISKAMVAGAKGIKIMVSGRLGGAEIARSEVYAEGTVPLQTLRADIDYGFSEAATTYGRIGVKALVYNGEIFKKADKLSRLDNAAEKKEKPTRFEKADRPRNRAGSFRSGQRFARSEQREQKGAK